jgi:hypothetical protein
MASIAGKPLWGEMHDDLPEVIASAPLNLIVVHRPVR